VERPNKKAPQPGPTWQRKQICGEDQPIIAHMWGRNGAARTGKRWKSYVSPDTCGNASRTRGLVLWADLFNGRFFVIFGSFAIFCGFLGLLGFSMFFWVRIFLFRFEFYFDSKLVEIQFFSNTFFGHI
jgi:hypothetical protein